MNTPALPSAEPVRGWWREPEMGLLLLLVVGVYFSRLSTLTLRGEETRRAQVAIEMLDTGDFIVPREQGRPFPDRPPLGNWLMALCMLVLGSHGTAAVRLPTVLATLASTLLVYGYSRTFLTRCGALAAGAAFATMGQVMQLGMLAETEATMTFFVGASLLVWHAGYCRAWPAWQTWVAGYTLAALATLAKGPQGPVYFCGAVGVYLAWRRQWRSLFSGWHLLGLAVGTGLVALWQVPYARALPWDQVMQTWGRTSATRFDYSQPLSVVEHLFSYPCEILICLLPWSLWLPGLASRDVRRSLGAAREPVAFLSICVLVAFPSCWLAPQARGRYFMPLYPCFALLIGLVIERAVFAARETFLARYWQRFNIVTAIGLSLTAVAVLGASLWRGAAHLPLAQPLWFALIYALTTAAAAGLLWWSRTGGDARRGRWGVMAFASFIGLTYTGIVVNALVASSEHVADNVAALKRQLPPDVDLKCLGRGHHAFVYHYGRTIPWLDWPKPGDPPPDYEYFCFHSENGRRKPLPFAWEEIAEVSCDRNRREHPFDSMVIGRRLKGPVSTSVADRTRIHLPGEGARQ